LVLDTEFHRLLARIEPSDAWGEIVGNLVVRISE
jgi:hypothetical protein